MMRRGTFSKLLGKVEQVSDKIFILGPDAATIAPSLKQFKIRESEHVEEAETFFCNKCGAEQKDTESRFCTKCGASLQPTIEEKS